MVDKGGIELKLPVWFVAYAPYALMAFLAFFLGALSVMLAWDSFMVEAFHVGAIDYAGGLGFMAFLATLLSVAAALKEAK